MIQDRIKELRRVRASDLSPNPKNWRTHPASQKRALRGALAEIGYADALLARELPDGRLELIDGHLRAETTPNQLVPVLVLDISEQEADKLLATLDPLASLAQADSEQLENLLDSFHVEDQALSQMLADLAKKEGIHDFSQPLPDEPELSESYQVIVQCNNETEQAAVYQRMVQEGYQCRVSML